MERHFHHDLEALRDRLTEMAGRAETALGKAMEALKSRDPNLAAEVRAEDLAIDRIELEVEGQCLNFLGLQQPVARDRSALPLDGQVDQQGKPFWLREHFPHGFPQAAAQVGRTQRREPKH